MKTIVCDTGPLLHLREIGMLDMLEKAGKSFKALDEIFEE